jgi:GNAT superfamily N-acetyltransferase
MVRESPVELTPRLHQLAGMFDLPAAAVSRVEWEFPDPPLDAEPWQIGLVVGPSGSGKSTVAAELFGDAIVRGYDWPDGRAVVDGFPADVGVRAATAALSSVGFSSPPNWLRPFRVLSNGEQFRATLARALTEPRGLVVLDEFTSVVDRTVARIGSAAVGKAVRRAPGKKFVAVTCHYDVADWLCPDWALEMPTGEFTRRSLRRRPPVGLEIDRVGREAWALFRPHHYLSHDLNPAAQCFAAFLDGRPVAFGAVLSAPGRVSFFREHRCVCLPDFQGVGIGNALSEFVAGVYRARGKAYRSTTANPAMIRHRCRSPVWKMVREPSLVPAQRGEEVRASREGRTRATGRLTAGFEYVGPVLRDEAKRLGVI